MVTMTADSGDSWPENRKYIHLRLDTIEEKVGALDGKVEKGNELLLKVHSDLRFLTIKTVGIAAVVALIVHGAARVVLALAGSPIAKMFVGASLF